ncbi:MAG: hypothetical protein EOO38_03615 [Cytophagaceae bacterium]|nr:MAG: hypothetical protein EOO38_03615 [Cytophagaceae bacterium]
MTRFDPSLIIRRMVVMRGAGYAYDEKFHLGVNVIRGENSSGKSTILNLIHYGLGGDVKQWSEAALLCDRVIIEAELSGIVVSLSRAIVEKGEQPMDIAFGSLESPKGGLNDWKRYPYRRFPSKESFSQVLFRQLGIAEAANEESGNITMHQVLRLLYADQMSPVDEIFSNQEFDSGRIRDAVGKLLCGAFDDELYSTGLAIREDERRLESVSAEPSRDVYSELSVLQKELSDKRRYLDSVVLEEEDSRLFIASLERKRTALADALLMARSIGVASFEACPACYADLPVGEEGHCALCSQPFDPDLAAERLGGVINDAAIQLRQSKLLQEHRRDVIAGIESEIADIESRWSQLASWYSGMEALPQNSRDAEVGDLHKRLGYLERQEEDVREKAKLIGVVDTLSGEKASLIHSLSLLKDKKSTLEMKQSERLKLSYLEISEQVRGILFRDLKRQDSFDDPKVVSFDFSKNRVEVDGHTYFSASSRAILKSAFVLGMHLAACKDKEFRHPRFIMLDTIEDKGMEAARSQNFQALCAELVSNVGVESQVVFGTAMIAPELDNDEFTVGRSYTRDSPSLIV